MEMVSAFDYIRSVYERLDLLPNEEYYMRGKKNSLDAKRLVEEELPLAVVLKHLIRPGIMVECEHLDGYQSFDASIRITDVFAEKTVVEEFDIEITLAVGEQDHLIRESMYVHGFSSGDPVIPKGEIRQRYFAKDLDHYWKKAVELIRRSIERKNGKSYTEGTRLIVSIVNDGRPFSIQDLGYINDSIHEVAIRSDFTVIYVVEPMQNQVLEVRRPRTA
jgi:hypothetical protein